MELLHHTKQNTGEKMIMDMEYYKALEKEVEKELDELFSDDEKELPEPEDISKEVSGNSGHGSSPEKTDVPKPDEKSDRGVAIYLRVSTDRQAEHGYSLQDQEERLREEARRRGFARLYKVEDAGESGTNFERKGLSEILQLATGRKIDTVLVTSLDRIGRDLIESLHYARMLRELGVKIAAMSGETDIATEEGLMYATIQFLSAELENKRRTKTSIAGRVQSFKQKHWNKPVPKGYLKKADGWIEKDPRWEQVIKDVFKLFLETGNYQTVKHVINEEHKETLPKPLTRQQVRQIICDPVYVGRPQYSGKASKKEFGRDITVEDLALAYVDQNTFERAREISKKIKEKYSRGKENVINAGELVKKFGSTILEEIPHIAVMCPECGERMVRNGTKILDGCIVQNYLCRSCNRQWRPCKEWVGR